VKNRILWLLIVLHLAIVSPAAAQSAQRGMTISPDANLWGKYHALIIGIDDYQEWPRLRTAVKDAAAIRDLLISRYGFDKENVILRTEADAGRLQILHDLRYLAQSMREDDNLLIYYAGHGQMDDFTGDGYWIPADGKLKDPGTWVANSYIKAVLGSDKLKAKNVVVIADSCYSGSMMRGGPSLMSLDDRRYYEKLAEKAALPSRQVISSGGIEPVADKGADGHSLFAYFFIKALEENNRDVIDLENLFHTRVWKSVTEIGNQRPNVGRLKTPMDRDGQFVLLNTALVQAGSAGRALQQAAPAPEKGSGAATERSAAPQNFNAEEEMWAIVKTSSIIEDYEYFLKEYPQSRFGGAARLKIQQLKRKQAPRSVATVPAGASHAKNDKDRETPRAEKQVVRKPAATEKNDAPRLAAIDPAATKPRHPAGEKYKLVLLPVQYSSTWSFNEGKFVRRFLAENESDDRTAVSYSYMIPEGVSDRIAPVPDVIGKDELAIWKKESVFAKPEPDWAKVKKIGSAIDVDFAVIIKLERAMDSRCEVYLYDYKTGKTYSKRNRTAGGYTDAGDVQQTLRDVMDDCLESQRQ